ncbi:MAG: hypothetical protein HY791_21610 [Deltaproteobacteria bacterium]|nr:hypothetical protein [Deltaproteobacteria bacterium]
MLASATSTVTAARSATTGLALEILGRPVLLDEGLPAHPRALGETQLGATLEVALVYSTPLLDLELGVGAHVRLPFAKNFDEAFGAAPIAWAELTPLDGVRLRLGTLRHTHGHHPAVFDETRAAYGRNLTASYRRALAKSTPRGLDSDPHLGAQQGAEVRASLGPIELDAYLDWQLLETIEHREKLAFGAVAKAESRFLRGSAELRLSHYGGQLFTAIDPIRFDGLDPVRQPTTYAGTLLITPLRGPVHAELGGSVVFAQGVGVNAENLPESTARADPNPKDHRFGIEPRVRLSLERVEESRTLELELGWRLWLPYDEGFFSEEGGPIYTGPRSHRFSLGTSLRADDVELRGRVDAIFTAGTSEVSYFALTELTFRLREWL